VPPSAERRIAPYAVDAEAAAARLLPEAACPMRTPFQRDRDRIVHATAFRRLTYKTQVFLYHEGDHYRTRMTHTIEVAQIARSIARQLDLDEDLAEALALAHDLGHPPFGHAGERALDAAMAGWGGFDHNAQSLRIVTRLERKYPAFDGLNLTLETLDGLIKHNGPISGPQSRGDHAVLEAAVARAGLDQVLDPSTFAAAEAQAAAIADDIAYNNHDIDDGLRAGLIAIDDLLDVPLVGRFVREAQGRQMPDRARVIYEVNRRMITAMIKDVVETARAAIDEDRITSAAAVRNAGRPVVDFSAAMAADVAALKSFLFAAVYRHPRVVRSFDGAQVIVRDLVERYRTDADALPAPWRAALSAYQNQHERMAVIADFVAGMTDRYAVDEHRRLFDATPELR
jgi:dGTPase